MKRSKKVQDKEIQYQKSKTPNASKKNFTIPKIQKFPSGNISKDNLEEETNFQIESTSKIQNDDKIQSVNINQNPSEYIEKLELKIQEQAKRLTEMRSYIHLCEKRIIQLNPEEKLPITNDSLKSQIQVSTPSKDNQYNAMYEKYVNLLQEHNELLSKQNNATGSSNYIKSSENEEQLKTLKKKNKELIQENNKILEMLKQETLNVEEQKNYIALLQQTIDSELIKSGYIKTYLTANDVIDFAKLKSEKDQIRKQLVVSQALVNSLKAEIEQMNFEKKGSKTNNNDSPKNLSSKKNKNSGNNRDNSMCYNNKEVNEFLEEISTLKTTIESQMQIISTLQAENEQFRKSLKEAGNKYIKDNDMITKSNIEKESKIKEYEEKFDYFNEYVSQTKKSLKNLQEVLNEYISIYNKIGNDDLECFLNKSFIESISQLNNLNPLNSEIEKFSLDTNDIELIQIAISLIKIIHNEFMLIYENLMNSKKDTIESGKKLIQLESKLKDRNITACQQNQSLNDLIGKVGILEKENNKMKDIFNTYNDNNYILSKEKNQIDKKNQDLIKQKDHLNELIDILIQKENFNQIGKLLIEAKELLEDILKMQEENEQLKDQLEDMKINKNMDMNEEEKLEYLVNDYKEKINLKENRLNQIKGIIKDMIKSERNANNCLTHNGRRVPDLRNSKNRYNFTYEMKHY